jgi:hypothetical protein
MSTQNLGHKQWRFESIDIRAGMAIALWREERRSEHGLPPELAPALFFSPPHFQPEPIVNTAVALSACRGIFEPGLYVDDDEQTEASFSTPEQVSEFLRRAYVGGAAGDGGDGGVGPEDGPVPPPDGDNGNWEPPPLYENRMVENVTTRIKQFEAAVQNIPKGSSKSFSWSERTIERQGRYIGSRPAQDHDATALVTAALALTAEMLRRMPTMSDATAWLRWYDDLRELTSIFVGLGVAELLQAGPFRDALKTIVQRSRMFEVKDMPEEERFDLCWLMLFGPTVQGSNSVEHLISQLYDTGYPFHYRGDGWIVRASMRVENPLDSLSRVPLPTALHSMLSADVRNKASVFHLLNLIVAEPQAVCRDHVTLQLGVCIALFASACIASTSTAAHSVWAAQSYYGHYGDERARRAIEQGHAWLIEHLPRTVFAKSYEAIIGKTQSLRYYRPM